MENRVLVREQVGDDVYEYYLPLTDDRAGEIPELLRRLLQLPEFRTKLERQGKVIRASQTQVQYYPQDGRIRTLSW